MDHEEQKKTIVEAVKTYFSELFGAKKDAPVTFDEAAVSRIVSQAVKSATDPLVEQNKQLTTQFTELSKKLDQKTADSLKSKAVVFVEKMKAAGKWLPAWDKQGVPAILQQLAISGQTVKFGEAGKETEVNAFDQMCAFYEGLSAVVPMGDITGRRKSASGNVIQFNEAKGIDLDMASVAFDERVKQIASEKKLSYIEAFEIAKQEISA